MSQFFAMSPLLLLMACGGETFNVKPQGSSELSVSAASLSNNQVIISGSNLDQVKSASISQSGLDTPLSISAKVGTLIVAGLGTNTTLRSALPLTLLLNTANAQTVVTLTVNLSGTTVQNFTSTGITDLASSTVMTLSSTGYAGIGTTTPSAPLHVLSAVTGGTNIRIENTDTGGRPFTIKSTGSGNAGGAGMLTILDNAANMIRLAIASSGNVGLGTATPYATLDVNGHIASSQATGSLNVSACGNGTIAGNDTRGVVTLGSTAVTSCTVNFASAFNTAPYCVVTSNSSSTLGTVYISAVSTTAMTLSFSMSTSSAPVTYMCLQ